MRDFKQLQGFCHVHRNDYNFLPFKGAFDRIENHQDYNRNGHYMQLFYAIYDFFSAYPWLASEAGVPAFEVSENSGFFDAWRDFINDDTNDNDGFTTESLRKNLSPACGGRRQGGGGWSPIAKILFPVVAVYLTS